MGGHQACRGGGGNRHWQRMYAPWLFETLTDSDQHQGFGVLSPQSARISLEGLGWGLQTIALRTLQRNLLCAGSRGLCSN